ncbi:MAG: ABC transporter substrate-binding protein [Actinobacteria bacterium]|nr:ABC transporter substrate-binding protein [Actinomycetota bacterium]
MRYPNEEIENYRRGAGELENELIDEYRAGTLTRKELIQRGSVLGMSIPLLGLLGGTAERAFAAPMAVGQRGGRIRIGTASIDASLEPPLLQTLAAISVTQISGEQLVYADKNAVLRPRLATSWKPSRGGRSWTFQIRRGVRFHDGKPMTADDVVATFRRLLGPDSQAQSSYKGVIDSVRKVGPNAVRFDLEAPNGLFPYLTGQMTYQSIILPRSYKMPTDLSKPGEFTSKMNGTGPFRLKENRGPGGISWEANPTYWGGRPALDEVDMQILDDQARVTALQSGQIDLAVQVTYEGARQLQRAGKKVLPIRVANHRYLNMNVTKEPFNDVRVRQAIALALDRPGLARGLWGQYAEVGNDSPMWPGYPYTAKVPQRKRDLERARALLRAAGKENLKVTLTCYRGFEMADYAQRVSQALRQIGIDCDVKVFTSVQYFDGVSFGANGKLAPWLATDFGIVDYGGRPVPTTYLNAGLKSGGVWNSARYKSKAFDRILANFIGAPDLAGQRKYAKQLQTQLLKDTPVIYAYFYNFIAATGANVRGYVPGGMADINLRGVTIR